MRARKVLATRKLVEAVRRPGFGGCCRPSPDPQAIAEHDPVSVTKTLLVAGFSAHILARMEAGTYIEPRFDGSFGFAPNRAGSRAGRRFKPGFRRVAFIFLGRVSTSPDFPVALSPRVPRVRECYDGRSRHRKEPQCHRRLSQIAKIARLRKRRSGASVRIWHI